MCLGGVVSQRQLDDAEIGHPYHALNLYGGCKEIKIINVTSKT